MSAEPRAIDAVEGIPLIPTRLMRRVPALLMGGEAQVFNARQLRYSVTAAVKNFAEMLLDHLQDAFE